ncbi:trypsin delta-like [Ylistrum balloti]|uniref:trypsin delta-like n=1 Tax=Ylistrum balloti TaxID=509963 RepID=UPI0029059B87|nr:trypsin delta-like [Ylistrum balloti]
MNGLLFACLLLVADSWALPHEVVVPRHPNEDLIKAAKPVPRHPSEDLIKDAEMRSHTRIIGGADASISDFPWQVSLQSYFNSHVCGGVILDDTTVLTAAHCLGSLTRVKYATANLRGGRTTSIVKQIRHANFDQGDGAYPNDIAILKVNSMTLDANAKAINVIDKSLASGTECTITGWGVTTTGGGGSTSNILQQAKMEVISDSVCAITWGSNICNTCHICITGDDARGACNGDSGGPMVCDNMLAGVTSWGVSGCLPNYPSVYTDLYHYRNWIETNRN